MGESFEMWVWLRIIFAASTLSIAFGFAFIKSQLIRIALCLMVPAFIAGLFWLANTLLGGESFFFGFVLLWAYAGIPGGIVLGYVCDLFVAALTQQKPVGVNKSRASR